MEDECFPTLPLSAACERLSQEAMQIKDEPLSETDSMHSSCPSSPQSTFMNTCELHFDVDMVLLTIFVSFMILIDIFFRKMLNPC